MVLEIRLLVWRSTSFRTRSLAQPLFEFGCTLDSPWLTSHIDTLEALLQSITPVSTTSSLTTTSTLQLYSSTLAFLSERIKRIVPSHSFLKQIKRIVPSHAFLKQTKRIVPSHSFLKQIKRFFTLVFLSETDSASCTLSFLRNKVTELFARISLRDQHHA